MKILVTGANGQLGSEMRIVSAGSADEYIFTDIAALPDSQVSALQTLGGPDVDTSTCILDITDSEAVHAFVRERGVEAIINCAAFTNVDMAESNYPLAEKLNAEAPAILASAMKDNGGVLVHISTDYVFGKEPYNTPCKEDRKGTPTGVYGLTKLHGEQKILESGCAHIIIRTAWLYSEFGKNFCRTMLRLTKEKPSLNVVFDQVGTPTYALDLAKAIFRIISQRLWNGCGGIYHFSNEGVCSWYDFTKMIQEYSGQTSCDVQPCHSDEFPSPVKRPSYSVLDKTLIKETFGVGIPYWTDSLRKCLGNIALVD